MRKNLPLASALLGFAAWFLVLTPIFGQTTKVEADLALVGGALIDGYGGPVQHDSVLLIKGERIVAIGSKGMLEIPSGAEVVNTDGYTMMPGLIDCHAHLVLSGHGNYNEYFPRWEPELERIMPLNAKQLLVHGGVTSARDLGIPLERGIAIRDAINAGEVVGPRLFVSGPFLQKSLPRAAPGRYDYQVQSFVRWTVDGKEDAYNKVRKVLDAGVDVVKIIQAGQMSDEELHTIAGEARKEGKPVAAHGGNLALTRRLMEVGVNSIEHMGGAGPRFEEESVRLMAAARNFYYVPTLIVGEIYNITLDHPERRDNQLIRDAYFDELYADVRSSIENFTHLNYFEGTRRRAWDLGEKFRQLLKGGVKIAAGTDSGTPMNFHTEALWQEMDLMVKYGMSTSHAIQSATRLAAQLLGKSNELGTLEVGKLADVIVVDGNPLSDIRSLKNVVHVFKGGRQYK